MAGYDHFGRLARIADPGDDFSISPTLVITYHEPASPDLPLWVELQQKIDATTSQVRKIFNG
jgi:hypothetical protein